MSGPSDATIALAARVGVTPAVAQQVLDAKNPKDLGLDSKVVTAILADSKPAKASAPKKATTSKKAGPRKASTGKAKK